MTDFGVNIIVFFNALTAMCIMKIINALTAVCIMKIKTAKHHEQQ